MNIFHQKMRYLIADAVNHLLRARYLFGVPHIDSGMAGRHSRAFSSRFLKNQTQEERTRTGNGKKVTCCERSKGSLSAMLTARTWGGPADHSNKPYPQRDVDRDRKERNDLDVPLMS